MPRDRVTPSRRKPSQRAAIRLMLLVFGLVVIFDFGFTEPSAPEAPDASPAGGLDRIIAQIQADLRPEEAMDTMRAVYSTDRWFLTGMSGLFIGSVFGL